MKILYGIQTTGNGHLSRAKEIIPKLTKRVQTDVLLSGPKNNFDFNHPVREHYKGFALYTSSKGNLNWLKTLFKNNLIRFFIEVYKCPVKEYDLVLNDFEPVTAWACVLRRKRCVGLSNQHAFSYDLEHSKNNKFFMIRWFVRLFAPSTISYGIYYKKINPRVFFPIIRSKVRALQKVTNTNPFFLVYLPGFKSKKLHTIFSKLSNYQWKIYSSEIKENSTEANLHFAPISEDAFLKDLARCAGVVTAAGFTTTSEALYLKKPLLVIPLKNQIEQELNAFILKKMGVSVIKNLKVNNLSKLETWAETLGVLEVDFPDETQRLVDLLLIDFIRAKMKLNHLNEKKEFKLLSLTGILTTLKNI